MKWTIGTLLFFSWSHVFAVEQPLASLLPEREYASQSPQVSADMTPVFFDKHQSTNLGLRSAYTWPTLFSNISSLRCRPSQTHYSQGNDAWMERSSQESRPYDRSEDVLYRLVFVGRHGQGVHNIAEAKYGSASWDAKWSILNGDGSLVWGPDANLTVRGQEEARGLRATWQGAVDAGLSVPVHKYVSPLSRALETAQLSFARLEDDSDEEDEYTDGLDDGDDNAESQSVGVTVLEELRETIGVHTCDLRSKRSTLARRFPRATFEHGFREEDELWQANVRESDLHTRLRARRVINRIMAQECSEWNRTSCPRGSDEIVKLDERVISITSHSGFLRNLFTEFDLGDLDMATAGMTGVVFATRCNGLGR